MARPFRRAVVLVGSLTLAVTAPLAEAAKPDAGTASTPAPAHYRIDGRDVPEAKFDTRLRELHGMFDYRCKKTTVGGIDAYRAQDPQGRWYRVQQVSGGEQPSTIELDSNQSASKEEPN